MANNNEIFKAYFHDTEKEAVDTKIEIEGFKDKYEKVKSQQIDFELDKLAKTIGKKTEDTFEKRFEAFKKAVLEKEAKLSKKGLLGEIQGKAEKTIEDKKNELKSKFEEKLGNIPLVGGFLKDALSWVTESENGENVGFGKKIFGMLGGMILSFFGYKKFKEQFDNVGEKTNTLDAGIDTIKAGAGDVAKTASELKEQIEVTNETRRDLYYKVGINSIMSLSGHKDESNGSQQVFKIIKEKKYSSLMSVNDEEKNNILKKSNNEAYNESLNDIIENLGNKNTNVILNSSLKSENVKNIIKPDGENINKRLFKFFGKGGDEIDGETRLKEIYKKAEKEKENFNWKDLSIAEISILYAEGYSALAVIGIDKIKGIGVTASELLNSNNSEEIQALKEGLKEKQSELVPLNLIDAFGKAYAGIHLGGNNIILKENDNNKNVRTKIIENLGKNPDQKEIEKLDKIIEFKDYLIGSFLESKRLIMDKNEYKEGFKKGLDYSSVISLYTIMGGKHLEEMPFGTMPILIGVVGSIMKTKDTKTSALESEYIVNFLDRSTDTEEDIFEAEEREVLKVYFKKAENLYISGQIKQLYRYTGILNHLNEDWMLTAGLVGTGATSSLIGKMLLKRSIGRGGISAIGLGLKKLGIIAIFAGIATAAAKAMNGTSKKQISFFDELEKIETIEELEKMTLKYKEAITSIEITKQDGKKEKMSLISYENDTPYVIYNGKIWIFDVVNEKGGLNPLDTSVETIGNKEVDLSKTVFDKEKITFGEGNNKYSIDFSSIANEANNENNFKPTEISDVAKFSKIINDEAKEFISKYTKEFTRGTSDLQVDILGSLGFSIKTDTEGRTYLPIEKVNNDSYDTLALIEVGSVNAGK